MSGGLFAYLLSTDAGFSHRVHLVDGLGGSLRRLTSSRASGRAAFSPDGTQVVFPGPLTDDSDGRYCLYRIGVDGRDLLRLTAPRVADADPAWSPDGLTLAFVRDPTGAMDPLAWRLLTMPAGGGGQAQKVDTPGAREPAWSPDGRQLAFAAQGRLYVVGADGTGLRVLADGGVRMPTWSPDGTELAFAQRLAVDRSRISTVPAAGGLITVRADLGAQAEDPAYAVDGRTVLFLSYDGQGWDGRRSSAIWRAPADGEAQLVSRLTTGGVRLAHYPDPPPGPVSAFTATEVTQRTARLRWTNPHDADLVEVEVRMAVGAQAPSEVTAGTLAYRGRTPDALVTGLEPATAYSFSAFARDRGGNLSGPTSTTTTTPPTGVPSPPDAVDAVPGQGSVRISWDPPLNDGGRPLTGYTVIVESRGQTIPVAATERSLVVTGLAVGDPVALSVMARNDLGPSTPSQARPVTPDAGAAAGTFTALAPQRLVDTRTSRRRIEPGTPVVVPIAGRAGLPSTGIAAVALSAAATDPVGSGFLTLHAAGASPPIVSTLNFVARQTIANADVVLPSSAGFALHTGGAAVHAVADVAGFYADERGPAGGRLNSITPTRLLDTRLPGGSALGAQGSLVVPVSGRAGVPAAGVASVVLILTAVTPSASTYLTVHPSDTARPTASVLNAGRGDTVAVCVIARLSADGRVAVYNNAGAVHLVADVLGYHTARSGEPGERYTPVPSSRVLDTRSGTGTRAGVVGPEEVVTVTLHGRAGVPASARTVLVNVTATQPSAATHVTVFPAGRRPPTTSVLNIGRGQTRANLVLAKLSADGRFSLRNNAGAVHLVADVRGYYAD